MPLNSASSPPRGSAGSRPCLWQSKPRRQSRARPRKCWPCLARRLPPRHPAERDRSEVHGDAQRQCDQPAAGHHSGNRSDHRADACHRDRPGCFPIWPPSCCLAWTDAEGTLNRRQATHGWDQSGGTRTAVYGWCAEPPRLSARCPAGQQTGHQLAAEAAAAPAAQAGRGRVGEQNGQNRMGHYDQRGGLSAAGGPRRAVSVAVVS